jgi:hypothetical protein
MVIKLMSSNIELLNFLPSSNNLSMIISELGFLCFGHEVLIEKDVVSFLKLYPF